MLCCFFLLGIEFGVWRRRAETGEVAQSGVDVEGRGELLSVALQIGVLERMGTLVGVGQEDGEEGHALLVVGLRVDGALLGEARAVIGVEHDGSVGERAGGEQLLEEREQIVVEEVGPAVAVVAVLDVVVDGDVVAATRCVVAVRVQEIADESEGLLVSLDRPETEVVLAGEVGLRDTRPLAELIGAHVVVRRHVAEAAQAIGERAHLGPILHVKRHVAIRVQLLPYERIRVICTKATIQTYYSKQKGLLFYVKRLESCFSNLKSCNSNQISYNSNDRYSYIFIADDSQCKHRTIKSAEMRIDKIW